MSNVAKEDLIKRGIVPGAWIKCVVDGSCGVVKHTYEWILGDDCAIVGCDENGEDLHAYMDEGPFAEVIAPPSTRMAELLKSHPEYRAAFEALHPGEVPEREPGFVEFGHDVILSFFSVNSGMILGDSYAPAALYRKCIMTGDGYKFHHGTHEGRDWVAVEKLPTT